MGSELSPPMPLIFSPSKQCHFKLCIGCLVERLRLRGIRRIVLELFNDGENEQDKDGGENEEYSRRLSDNVGAAMTSISSIQHGAPLKELVSILATSMSQLYSINSMSLSRVKFVKALRERWLKQELLPFMSTSTDEGGGDHKTSPHFLNTLFLLESNAIQLPPLDFRQIAQELKPSSVGRVSTDEKVLAEKMLLRTAHQ
ncbi:unnamed protein product [Peronospora belbahrii]|uniref:Uncharacterized protein n=1 Tax=Peronospora belbahrii TaxID=622444 RepID=A0ABN8CMS9_9STRA|nr:unnamed protein product [Peronospora belbahrii]